MSTVVFLKLKFFEFFQSGFQRVIQPIKIAFMFTPTDWETKSNSYLTYRVEVLGLGFILFMFFFFTSFHYLLASSPEENNL